MKVFGIILIVLISLVALAPGIFIMTVLVTNLSTSLRETRKQPRGSEKVKLTLSVHLIPFTALAGLAICGKMVGKEVGVLWAFFCTQIIIQFVLLSMFGFALNLISSVVTGIFFAVEILVSGGYFVVVILGFTDWFATMLIGGIVAISVGAVAVLAGYYKAPD